MLSRQQYHNTIAVELATVERPVSLAAGASWTAAQTFTLL